MKRSEAASTDVGGQRLRGSIGYATYFALGFGCIVGSGWVLLLKEWIGQAGIGGSIIGILCGGIVMAAIASCYAELTNRLPEAGGEFVYMRETFGETTAFITGWFLLLNLVSVMIFEGIALALSLRQIFPWLSLATVYTALGKSVTLDGIGIGAIGALTMGFINIRGNKSASSFHNVLTYGFLLITILLLGYIATVGRTPSARTLFPTEAAAPWWHGTLWIFATCGLLLNGFQIIPQAIEERDAGLKLSSIVKVMIVSVVSAALFYCFAIIACGFSLSTVEISTASMPPILAISKLPLGNMLSSLFLIGLVMSILKTWNGVLMTAVRLVVAMARVGHLPPSLARTREEDSTPVFAITCLSLLTAIGAFLGSGAIIPIINMCSIGATAVLATCCAGMVVLRRRDAGVAYFGFRAGGWSTIIGLAGALLMAIVALIAPSLNDYSWIPVEYALLIGWAIIGMLFWSARSKRFTTSGRKLG